MSVAAGVRQQVPDENNGSISYERPFWQFHNSKPSHTQSQRSFRCELHRANISTTYAEGWKAWSASDAWNVQDIRIVRNIVFCVPLLTRPSIILNQTQEANIILVRGALLRRRAQLSYCSRVSFSVWNFLRNFYRQQKLSDGSPE